MSAATATVEVLAAEVRVLMVGSRQVTLSVYRQLDEVEPENIEPFGRVRDAKDDEGVYVYVVGSDDTGALVRSRQTHFVRGAAFYADDLVVVGPSYKVQYPGGPLTRGTLTVDGRDVSVLWDYETPSCEGVVALEDGTDGDRNGDPGPCRPLRDGETPRYPLSRCDSWHFISDDARAEAARRGREALARFDAETARRDAWVDLPLIVLAGLR